MEYLEVTEYDLGYQAYMRGLKRLKNSSYEFSRGWFAAADNGEKFGEYDSFLAAP